MNDISVKLVESQKEPPVAAEPQTGEAGSENEVDPLALDEAEVGAKDPLVEVSIKEEKAGICDENAKDEKLSENVKDDCNSLVALEAEKIKEELLKEDSNSPSALEEEASEKPLSHDSQVAELVHHEAVPNPISAVSVPMTVAEVSQEPEDVAPVAPKPTTPEVTLTVKETSLMKDPPHIEEPSKTPVVDVEMSETPRSKEKVESKVDVQPKSVNGDINKSNHKDNQPSKRRASEEVETESPLKKLCQEVEKTFPQHDIMINDYIQTATKNNIDEIQRHTEQLLSEIQTLRELAQKKEQEWNNILHLKKVKEEILLRLLRRKQVLSFEKAAEINGSDRTDPFDYLNQAKNLAIDKSDEISGLAIKQPGSTINPMLQTPVMPVTTHFNPMSGLPPPYDKAHMQNMPKPVFQQPMMMPGHLPGFPRDMNGQLPGSFNMPMGRQGPTKDVKSIIADYRQRNPDVTPRRGRRLKSILNPNMMGPRAIAPKMDGLGNLSNLNNLHMLFNNLDMNQKAMLERLQQMQAGGLPNGMSFKDVLVQFASMQQASAGLIPPREAPEPRPRPPRRHDPPVHETVKQVERLASPSPRLPPPPPYPEISLLPVTTAPETQTSQNSLLHGILTKVQKNCGEITITPVQPAPPPAPDPQPEKPEEVVQLDDEESPGSEGSGVPSPGGSGGSGGSGSGSGRLVIDEAGAAPLCQGCRRRDAQFVCAGCANQWYCSRDCQVAAWDEHSEMCSG